MSENNETIETKQAPDPMAEDKARSKKYVEELRRVIQARIVLDDGTLSDPGVLPQEELIQHYLGKPLKNKDVDTTTTTTTTQSEA
jgi:hypothetical protein